MKHRSTILIFQKAIIDVESANSILESMMKPSKILTELPTKKRKLFVRRKSLTKREIQAFKMVMGVATTQKLRKKVTRINSRWLWTFMIKQ